MSIISNAFFMVWVNVFNRIFSYFRFIDKSVVNLKNDVKLFEIDIFPKKLGRGKEALSLSRKRAEIKKKKQRLFQGIINIYYYFQRILKRFLFIKWCSPVMFGNPRPMCCEGAIFLKISWVITKDAKSLSNFTLWADITNAFRWLLLHVSIFG